MKKNELYYGDNLTVLREHIKADTVDLVYLDPPFNSDRNYSVLFDEQDGSRSAAQIKAFTDTWRWDQVSARQFFEVVEQGGAISRTLQALRQLLGDSDMLAYLTMMAPRLMELHRVLGPNGSLYLHCDPTASHYLKILLDAIFLRGFRSEIIWSYKRWPSKTPNYQHMHDVLLYYTKGPNATFNTIYEPASASFLKRFGGKTSHLEAGATRKQALDTATLGMPLRDVWDLSILAGSSAERLGYPTQKPLKLLERIIEVSSNPGDVILDPFCGCGTAVSAAQALGRRWIGVDVTCLATNLIKQRLRDTYGNAIDRTYDVIGEPITIEEARTLAASDPYQFQWWALGLVGARPADKKKGADKGVDGRLYFHDGERGEPTKQIVFSVKAGKLEAEHVRDLGHVVTREQAQIGVLLSLQPSTRNMRSEVASAGYYESAWGTHPRLQILTVGELLAGARIDFPPASQVNRTFKAAPKHQESAEPYQRPLTGTTAVAIGAVAARQRRDA